MKIKIQYKYELKILNKNIDIRLLIIAIGVTFERSIAITITTSLTAMVIAHFVPQNKRNETGYDRTHLPNIIARNEFNRIW
jgi:hypothetical protein